MESITISDRDIFIKELNDICIIDANIIFDGDLDCSSNKISKLPNNLTIYGDLICNNNDITELPINLHVTGDLMCSYNKLKYIHCSIFIGKGLFCYGNKITSKITCYVGDKIYMDNIQKEKYDSANNIERIKKRIKNQRCRFGY